MALTWPVAGAVLFGALLHAGWNALVKSSSDKALDTALIHLSGSLVALPLMLWAGPPRTAAWPFIAASLVIHIGYYTALSGAYTHGELGLTYPLMRGSPPLLVALASSVVLRESPSPLAWVGVLAVSAGVLTLGLSRHALDSPRAVAFALGNAVLIALYTLVDGTGVRTSGNALQYVATLFAFDGWPFALIVLSRRGRAVAWPYARRRGLLLLIAACASLGSYGIALWAMTRAPVAAVAALRESSVLFAMFIGVLVLRERFTARRAIATGTIAAGVMALRLG